MSKYLEVGKVYKAQIVETYFKHKISEKRIDRSEHEAEAFHIISSADSDESTIHFWINSLSDESNELTLDEIEKRLNDIQNYISKIKSNKKEAVRKYKEYLEQYEEVKETHFIPFIVNGITLYDKDSEDSIKLQDDKDYRKDGEIDRSYEIEYDLSHCGFVGDDAVNDFVEVTDNKEIEKIKKEIKDWNDWQGEMVDMTESQYC